MREEVERLDAGEYFELREGRNIQGIARETKRNIQ